MHPYIPFLLDDISSAHRTEVSEYEEPEQDIEDYFEEIEKWINEEDEPKHTFGDYCGLNSENFPPAEQLSDDEMILIRKAFERMMYTWNLNVDFPENLPAAFAYKVTVDTLNMKTDIVNSGFVTFDFCSGYAPDCIFKEYCPCLEIWNEESDNDMDMKLNEDELPF
jgi:hypothetical protein